LKYFKLLFLSILLYIPLTVRADNNPLELSDFFTSELQIIEEKIKELNPRLVSESANDDDALKIVKYNNYLAEYIFDEYLGYVVWALREKSNASGRAIKSEQRFINGAHEYTYWLDRGIMDSEECNGGRNGYYHAKEDTCAEIEKSIEWERSHLCLYPDKFEENRIEILEDRNGYSSFMIVEESFKDDIRRDLYFSLDRKTEETFGDENVVISLHGSYHMWPWTKSQEERNFVVQDIKDGMLECLPVSIEGCEPGQSGIFCHGIGIKGNIEDWRSSKVYMGEIGNFSKHYSYSHIKE